MIIGSIRCSQPIENDQEYFYLRDKHSREIVAIAKRGRLSDLRETSAGKHLKLKKKVVKKTK